MYGIFYNLGRRVGPKVRKAKWLWHSLAGSKSQAIQIEKVVGHDLAEQIKAQLNPEDYPAGLQLLHKTGSRLGRCVANELYSFNFELVTGTEPNAFALPGGYIFVTRSLGQLCGWDEDEMAFILAHEMAHVIRGHAINRIVSSSAIKIVSNAASLNKPIAVWLKKLSIQFLESTYSRELESEADRLAIYLTEAAGYNPKSATILLQRLAKLKSQQNQNNVGRYFASHPDFYVRIADINNQLARMQKKS